MYRLPLKAATNVAQFRFDEINCESCVPARRCGRLSSTDLVSVYPCHCGARCFGCSNLDFSVDFSVTGRCFLTIQLWRLYCLIANTTRRHHWCPSQSTCKRARWTSSTHFSSKVIPEGNRKQREWWWWWWWCGGAAISLYRESCTSADAPEGYASGVIPR